MMTDSYSSPSEEVRILADAMFDGSIVRAQMDRLESLILADVGCLQAYVERMTFHGELIRDSEAQTPEQAATAVLKEFSHAIRLRERRLWMAQFWIYGAMAASLLLIVGSTLFFTGAFQPSPLGVVSSLTADLRTRSGAMDLGQIVRMGESLTIQEGLVSLQFPNVMVDVLGPATVRLDGATRIYLSSGMLLAKIQKGGEGFTVSTPDVAVVDLGTEFLVKHDAGSGTDVSVRQGRARGTLLDWRGKPTKVLELTDSRAARFHAASQSAREMEYEPLAYAPIDRCRGGILSIDGTLRTATRPPGTLVSGQVLTPNHMLVIPERQNVVLDQELIIQGSEGVQRIPAGSTVSSYLVHYDPTTMVTTAPRGAVTFFDEISAIVVNADDLKATDSLLGLPGMRFESASYRQLELEEDEVRISKDRRTVSFYCGVNPGEHLDEARILIVSEAGPAALSE